MKMQKRGKPRRKSPGSSGGSAMAKSDPIVASIKAYFRPFDAEKGVAAPLADGRPSQKFMSKAQTQITLASGQIFCFMTSPNVANNATYASLVFAIGSSTGGLFTTDGAWKNLSVGDKVGPFGTIQTLATNSPYGVGTLTGGYEYACVGSGLKFTYEGSELYRGGTMRYIYDKEGAYNAAVDWTADTVNGLINFVNTAPNTIRQSINKENVVEINTTATNSEYQECTTINETAYSPAGSGVNLLGGTTASTYFALRPNVIGYYVNVSGAQISFHVDVVEHWSISHPDIQSLQTPSYVHAPMAAHVASLMDNVRQNHAGKPNTHHASVAVETMKVMQSPIGHEVLNVGLKAAFGV